MGRVVINSRRKRLGGGRSIRRAAASCLFTLSAALAFSACSRVTGGATHTPFATPARELEATVGLELPASAPHPVESPGAPGMSCQSLTGWLEVELLFSAPDGEQSETIEAAAIPIKVVNAQAPYQVRGEGVIEVVEVLEIDGAIYEIALDLEVVVEGECYQNNNRMLLFLQTAGDQMLLLGGEGLAGRYPSSSARNFRLDFPLFDGVKLVQRGWGFVLHLQE